MFSTGSGTVLVVGITNGLFIKHWEAVLDGAGERGCFFLAFVFFFLPIFFFLFPYLRGREFCED